MSYQSKWIGILSILLTSCGSSYKDALEFESIADLKLSRPHYTFAEGDFPHEPLSPSDHEQLDALTDNNGLSPNAPFCDNEMYQELIQFNLAAPPLQNELMNVGIKMPLDQIEYTGPLSFISARTHNRIQNKIQNRIQNRFQVAPRETSISHHSDNLMMDEQMTAEQMNAEQMNDASAKGSVPEGPGFWGISEPLTMARQLWARQLWATYYYLPKFHSEDEGIPLLSSQGKPIGPRLSEKNWCTAALEGSFQVYFGNQWTTYNYASSSVSSQVDCSPYFPYKVGGSRFQLANGPFGDGVRNYKLVPFRTIAVDPKLIPFGSVIYIPEARGNLIPLVDGRQIEHDGYFFAADTGGAIRDNHIDVFIGSAARNPFPWVGSQKKATFVAFKLENHPSVSCFEKLHH